MCQWRAKCVGFSSRTMPFWVRREAPMANLVDLQAPEDQQSNLQPFQKDHSFGCIRGHHQRMSIWKHSPTRYQNTSSYPVTRWLGSFLLSCTGRPMRPKASGAALVRLLHNWPPECVGNQATTPMIDCPRARYNCCEMCSCIIFQ